MKFYLDQPKDINKMNVLEMTTNNKNQLSEPMMEMITKTVNELRSIAKDTDLHRYYKLKRADVIVYYENNQLKNCQHHHRGVRGRKVGLNFQ